MKSKIIGSTIAFIIKLIISIVFLGLGIYKNDLLSIIFALFVINFLFSEYNYICNKDRIKQLEDDLDEVRKIIQEKRNY